MSLAQLPDCVLEDVLGRLSYRDVSRLRAVSRQLYRCCAAVLCRGFTHVQQELVCELAALRQQLSQLVPQPGCRDSVEHVALCRAELLRAHSLLQLLLSELLLLRATTATHHQLCVRCYPGGHLLDAFCSLLDQAKNRALPAWSMETDVSCKLLEQIKSYMGGYRRSPYYNSPPLGVLCCDLLDALVDVDACITATLDGSDGSCHLVADYRLIAAHVLWPPRLEPPAEGSVTLEQARALGDYLCSLVRFNNRVALRQLQFYREVDLALVTRGVGVGADCASRGSRLWKPPHEYPAQRRCVVAATEESSGDFQREDRLVVSCSQEGPRRPPADSAGALFCHLQLVCPLSAVPLQLRRDARRAVASLERPVEPGSGEKRAAATCEEWLQLRLGLELADADEQPPLRYQYEYVGGSAPQPTHTQ